MLFQPRVIGGRLDRQIEGDLEPMVVGCGDEAAEVLEGSKLRMDRDAMTRRMTAAVANPFTNVLGHCTGRLVTGGRGTRPQSDFDARAVFEACVEHDVAVEINARPERRDPPTDLLQLAIDIGCLFSIDSDAHAPGQLDFQVYGCARAEDLGLEPERVVNTWPRDRLLRWARAKRGG